MKKILCFVLICMYIISLSSFASVNEPLKKLGKGLNNVVYGSVELPDNINATKSKGTKAFNDCTDKTKGDVGRSIARVVGGLFQIAMFWYPETSDESYVK